MGEDVRFALSATFMAFGVLLGFLALAATVGMVSIGGAWVGDVIGCVNRGGHVPGCIVKSLEVDDG